MQAYLASGFYNESSTCLLSSGRFSYNGFLELVRERLEI